MATAGAKYLQWHATAAVNGKAAQYNVWRWTATLCSLDASAADEQVSCLQDVWSCPRQSQGCAFQASAADQMMKLAVLNSD